MTQEAAAVHLCEFTMSLCIQARVAPKQEVAARAPAHKCKLCMVQTNPMQEKPRYMSVLQ